MFPELSAEMELGCSVFLEEEDDNKDNVLAAGKNATESSEQTLINELTNIFKTTDNQPAPNLRKISDDDKFADYGRQLSENPKRVGHHAKCRDMNHSGVHGCPDSRGRGP